ncbi:unnamed protein product [Strongylus vulgaris]|uniref:Uncharacterized protein n=1 Tax=Strongylus vulgaris TaxID=40348 RepID=A0A3P7JJB3_STRVU|nr:unnamed protein product [Strongylus vulgaris]
MFTTNFADVKLDPAALKDAATGIIKKYKALAEGAKAELKKQFPTVTGDLTVRAIIQTYFHFLSQRMRFFRGIP